MRSNLSRTLLATAAVGTLTLGTAACTSDGDLDDPVEDVDDGIDDPIDDPIDEPVDDLDEG